MGIPPDFFVLSTLFFIGLISKIGHMTYKIGQTNPRGEGGSHYPTPKTGSNTKTSPITPQIILE